MTTADPSASASGSPPAGSRKRTKPVRTRTVYQMTDTECGAASLAMVLDYYGREVDLETLRLQCGIGRDGATPKAIRNAARAQGMTFTMHRTSPGAAADLPAPFIAYWEHRHFLVVEGHNRRGWHLNDPQGGRYTVTDAEWEQRYSDVAFVCEPGPDFVPHRVGERAYFASLLRPVRDSLVPLALAVLLSLLLVFPAVVTPTIAAAFIDNVLIDQDRSWLRGIISAMVVIGVLTAAMRLLEIWIKLHLSFPLHARMNAALLWHLLRLPMEFFTQRPIGGLMSRIHKTDAIANLMLRGLPSAITGAVTMIAMLGALAIRSLTLAAIAVVSAVISLLSLLLVARTRRSIAEQGQSASFQLSGATMTGLREMDAIKAQGAGEQFLAQFMSTQADTLAARQRLTRVSAIYGIVPRTVRLVTSLVLLGVGALGVMAGSLTVGSVVACIMLADRFLAPVSTFLGLGQQLQTTHATLTQINDVLTTPVAPGFAADAETAQPTPATRGEVRLDSLSFSYTPYGRTVLDSLDLTIPAGAHVAIVGRTGSGKTTLGNVIAGTVTPTSGRVLIDGVDLAGASRTWITTVVGKVNQDPYLFAGTVADNVTMWDPTIPAATVSSSLSQAQARDFVARRGGLDADVAAEGRNYSGGQTQMLVIARALARTPAVLVLDEATSALDSTTQAALLAELADRGCTVITIAHRLSTVRNADRIIVLDAGKVAESGTHDELMAANGIYAAQVRAR